MLKSVIYMHRFQLNDATKARVERNRSEIPDSRSQIGDPKSPRAAPKTEPYSSRPKYEPKSPSDDACKWNQALRWGAGWGREV